ncbi:hypothetical protein CDAR_380671 [Caerostris darwini]|uniref:Uncharacterized protein n=1 Tax=Caerostris darwini TaxID=1538125 RepID=A0AAV4QPJ4_9ARAC|nr:hypothetical protein CDAR_380671 [Caerostris darwini]
MHVIPFQLTRIKKTSSHHQRSSSPLSIPYKVPVDLPFHHPYSPPYFFQNSSLGFRTTQTMPPKGASSIPGPDHHGVGAPWQAVRRMVKKPVRFDA